MSPVSKKCVIFMSHLQICLGANKPMVHLIYLVLILSYILFQLPTLNFSDNFFFFFLFLWGKFNRKGSFLEGYVCSDRLWLGCLRGGNAVSVGI